MGRRILYLAALLALTATVPWALAQVEGSPASTEIAKALQQAQAGQPETAIKQLGALVSKTTGPDKDAAETALGSVYRMTGKVKEARASLKKAIDRSAYVPALLELYHPPFEPKTAITRLRTALDHDVKNVEVRLELAQAYVNDAQLAPAIAAYNELTEKIAPQDLRAYFGLARVYILQNRVDKAKPVLEKTMQMAPQDPEPYYEMGNMVNASTKEPQYKEKAVSWWERAAELGKTNPKYVSRLIYGYFRTGQNLAAGPMIDKLDQMAPSSSEANWARGVNAEFNVELQKAAQHYKLAAALNSQNADAQYTLGVFLAGHVNQDFILAGQMRDWKYLPFRDPDRATIHLKTALAINPAYPFAARARALLEEMDSLSVEAPVRTPEMEEMLKRLDDFYRRKARQF
jgi:tetratricopeptide (TPR) repeat protein